MKNLMKFALLALSILLAGPALAQETAKPAAAFPIGKTPEVKIGQTYVVKKYGDWQVRCIKVKEGPEPCHIFQLMQDAKGNSVAEINLFHLPGGGAAVAGANVVTPLGTLLLDQLKFSIDGNPSKSYPFSWCEGAGCVARMGLTGLELEALKTGTKATVTISSINAPNRPIVLNLSLKGFSAAFNAVLVKK